MLTSFFNLPIHVELLHPYWWWWTRHSSSFFWASSVNADPFPCRGRTELILFWLQCPDPAGSKPKETWSTFVASNINGVIECIDYIITFPSIREPTEMYSLNNWKCIHERFFISMVAQCNCAAPLFQYYCRFYLKTHVCVFVYLCDKRKDWMVEQWTWSSANSFRFEMKKWDDCEIAALDVDMEPHAHLLAAFFEHLFTLLNRRTACLSWLAIPLCTSIKWRFYKLGERLFQCFTCD